jgi:hypothetical protein
MKKVFVFCTIIAFFAIYLPAVSAETPAFNIGINEAYYSVHLEKDGNLFLNELPKGERRGYTIYWQDFVDIDQQFPEEIVRKIASKLVGSYHLCKNKKIFKAPSRDEPNVFGAISQFNEKGNIFISPGKLHAIVKSGIGPYFLLNLKTLEFENFCIGNGEDVAWYGDSLLAVAYLDSGVLDVRRTKNETDTILIYDIQSNKKQYLRYENKRIEDIQFLKDGESLVVALSEITNYFNPLNFIFSFIGHPITYRNFSVEIFKYKSNQSKIKIIKKNVGNGFSFFLKQMS